MLLVTGGASGIGRATAERVSAEGGRAVIVDLDRDAAEAAAAEIPGSLGLGADVADEDAVAAAVATAVDRFGTVDLALAAAGHAQFGPVADWDTASFNRMLTVHIGGTFNVCKHVLPRRRPSRRRRTRRRPTGRRHHRNGHRLLPHVPQPHPRPRSRRRHPAARTPTSPAQDRPLDRHDHRDVAPPRRARPRRRGSHRRRPRCRHARRRSAAANGEEFCWDHAAADTLVELITGQRAIDRRVPDVAVHIDWTTLINGLHPASLCELGDGTAIPVSTVRRLCCEAEIFPIITGPRGETLDVGRAHRLANRAQRRALRAMYRTCGHPHCDVVFDRCEIHHVIPWEHLGPTDLANLLPLGGVHHHLVHEGGWTLTLRPDRTITVTRPDGTLQFAGRTNQRTQPSTRTAAVAPRTDHPPGHRPPQAS